MLIKLIKYDLKSLNRILIILHAFLLLTTVLLRVFITGRIQLDSDFDSLMFGLSVLMYTLLITGITFGTAIVVAVRFYKNLFSDEGYLSQTLPVTMGQHLLSKTIAGSLWGWIDYILILVSLYIGVATPEFLRLYNANQDEILRQLGFTGKYASVTPVQIILLLLIAGLIGCVANSVMYYASIVLGQLFSSHRVIGAIACYFGLSTILAAVSFIVMFIADLTSGGSNLLLPEGQGDLFNFVEYMIRLLTLSMGISAITTAVLYVLALMLMKKKLDLN